MDDLDLDFNFDFDFELNIDCEGKKEVQFVNKHSSSKKIIDFTKIEFLNDIMRFNVISSLNFTIPNKNESLFLLTTKAISLLDVVHFIEQRKGEVEEAYLFFYTINDKAALYTCSLAKRANLKIIISDLMNSKREKERLITKIFDENNVDICFCHNHSKIASFKIGDNFFTLTGSMNAGNNARIESLPIINSKKMYTFVSETFDVFKEKFIINKRY